MDLAVGVVTTRWLFLHWLFLHEQRDSEADRDTCSRIVETTPQRLEVADVMPAGTAKIHGRRVR